jgi:superfamily II DNA helicase RecQ
MYNNYFRTIDMLTQTYGELVHKVEMQGGNDALIEIYHAHLDKKSEVTIPQDFIPDSSPVRCLIATLAFGLGMQVNNISYVIHWGPPSSILDYFQEIGRCARNGMDGKAILYKPIYTMRKDKSEEDMIDIIIRSSTKCIRYMALKAPKLSLFSEEEIKDGCFGSRCCSFCNA